MKEEKWTDFEKEKLYKELYTKVHNELVLNNFPMPMYNFLLKPTKEEDWS